MASRDSDTGILQVPRLQLSVRPLRSLLLPLEHDDLFVMCRLALEKSEPLMAMP